MIFLTHSFNDFDFMFHRESPELLDDLDIDEATRKCLLSNIKRRLTPQPVKIRADIEVACYAYEGVDAVKEALRAGLALSTDDFPIKVNWSCRRKSDPFEFLSQTSLSATLFS